MDESKERGASRGPDRERIMQRAHELWKQRGCPEGSAEEDWLQAEKEVTAAEDSQKAKAPTESGSVQR